METKTETEITIRKASVSDISAIRALAERTFPATYRGIITEEQIAYMMEWMYSLASLRRQMEEEGHEYFLAIAADGAPVGYVSIQREAPDLFHLHKIYVDPARQGCRVGAALFRHAVERVRSLHPAPCAMELNVNRENPALAFYRRMGMEKAREGDFPIGGGFFMRDYIMRLEIR